MIYAAIPENLHKAVQLLQQNQVVAVPTETVYGLAANAYNDHAVAQIYAIKQRPQFNPLIIHYPSVPAMATDVVMSEAAQLLATAFWPGPLTLVLPKQPGGRVSSLAAAGGETVAVRIPKHPVMQQLLKTLPFPLAAPSANPSGRLSPTEAKHVEAGLGAQLSMILDGGTCEVGLESTILDLTTPIPSLLRPGGISPEDIMTCLGTLITEAGPEQPALIKAPGQLSSHYAPRQRVRLNVIHPEPHEALLAFGPSAPLHPYMRNLSTTGDLVEAAANLFRFLHELDALPTQGIAVMPIPNEGVGVAINDRLLRAAH